MAGISLVYPMRHAMFNQNIHQYAIRWSTQCRQDRDSVSRNSSTLSCSIIPPSNPASLRGVLSVFDNVDEISLYITHERCVICREAFRLLNWLFNYLEEYNV